MSGTEVSVELEPLNDYSNDDKDKKPLLPISNIPSHGHKGIEKNEVTVIGMVVGFYWVCSMSVVFLNKYIFTYAEFEFPFPLFHLVNIFNIWIYVKDFEKKKKKKK